MSSLQDLQAIEEQLDQTISELAPLLVTPKKEIIMTQTDESPESVATGVRNLQDEIELEGEEKIQDALEEELPQEESKPKAKAQLKKPPPEQTPAPVLPTVQPQLLCHQP